jgi:hypothetical protein
VDIGAGREAASRIIYRFNRTHDFLFAEEQAGRRPRFSRERVCSCKIVHSGSSAQTAPMKCRCGRPICRSGAQCSRPLSERIRKTRWNIGAAHRCLSGAKLGRDRDQERFIQERSKIQYRLMARKSRTARLRPMWAVRFSPCCLASPEAGRCFAIRSCREAQPACE